jgi:hypothetical protein
MDIQFSKKVKILPWIGRDYKKNRSKILVLGMSTYNKDDPKKYCVRIMAEKVCHGNSEIWARYWVRITNLIKNKNENIYEFWNRISFYNYIQEIMNEPKQKTPKDYWENAKEPFKEILAKLRPDVVIVTGYQTFENLPDEFILNKPIFFKNETLKTGIYKIVGKTINICATKHPASYGFSLNTWRQLLKKYYNKVL